MLRAFFVLGLLWLGSPWPDLVAGALIAVVASLGGVEILRNVRQEVRT